MSIEKFWIFYFIRIIIRVNYSEGGVDLEVVVGALRRHPLGCLRQDLLDRAARPARLVEKSRGPTGPRRGPMGPNLHVCILLCKEKKKLHTEKTM